MRKVRWKMKVRKHWKKNFVFYIRKVENMRNSFEFRKSSGKISNFHICSYFVFSSHGISSEVEVRNWLSAQKFVKMLTDFHFVLYHFYVFTKGWELEGANKLHMFFLNTQIPYALDAACWQWESWSWNWSQKEVEVGGESGWIRVRVEYGC